MPQLTKPQHGQSDELRSKPEPFGLAQLSLVEHSLCPLDSRISLQPQLVHQVSYDYTDPSNRKRKTANVTITAPKGLSAKDEYLLFGLLAITFNQREPSQELWISPVYCMRQLGFEERSQRGGWRFHCFKEALDRLAYVIYDADAFYLPDLGEHRPVIMGLLKRDHPLDLGSNRQWRITWDQRFFEICQHASGRFFFDLDCFRELSFASRRLFLLLLKIFTKGRRSPWFDVEKLAINTLGYQASLPLSKLKQQVARCAEELQRQGVVEFPAGIDNVQDLFRKNDVGSFSIRFRPGSYFRQSHEKANRSASPRNLSDSPQYDPLKQIGFSDREISTILRDFPEKQVIRAADITLKAIEGGKDIPTIKKSPKAFFRFYVKHLSEKRVTPPDWYRESEKQDRKQLIHSELRQMSDEYQAAYQSELESFVKQQQDSDRYNNMKEVFLAQHLRVLSRDQAIQAAEQDTLREIQSEFDFPEESIWMQRHYFDLKQTDA